MKKKSILLILGIGVIALCLASAGCVGNSSNPLSKAFDPIVGKWLSNGAELELNMDGTGTLTEFGFAKATVKWEKTGDRTYSIEPYVHTCKLSSDGKKLEPRNNYYRTFEKL